MTQNTEILPASLLQQLAEAGFLASEMGFSRQAIAIFTGLAKINPSIPQPGINLAIVHARCGELDIAIQQLRSLHERFPESHMVKAMLGLCLVELEEPDAFTLLDEVMREKQDPDAVRVAQSCFDVAQQQQQKRELKPPPTDGLQFFRHYNHQG